MKKSVRVNGIPPARPPMEKRCTSVRIMDRGFRACGREQTAPIHDTKRQVMYDHQFKPTRLGLLRRIVFALATIPLYFTLLLLGGNYDSLVEWWKTL